MKTFEKILYGVALSSLALAGCGNSISSNDGFQITFRPFRVEVSKGAKSKPIQAVQNIPVSLIMHNHN